ncbi:hypothetical protein CPC08DRAFT_728274 [Agrocybe pediades]|nr:hypothetical protein CPC08DRAFT_728274 [Agrocybe pediades]
MRWVSTRAVRKQEERRKAGKDDDKKSMTESGLKGMKAMHEHSIAIRTTRAQQETRKDNKSKQFDDGGEKHGDDECSNADPKHCCNGDSDANNGDSMGDDDDEESKPEGGRKQGRMRRKCENGRV